MPPRLQMRFCRRCGAKLKHAGGPRYTCEQGHILFRIVSPAIALAIINDKNEVLILVRAVDPGKGLWDLPGGFCDGAESLEAAVARETAEETGLSPEDYSPPEFVMSEVDDYEYDHEIVSVLDAFFVARLRSAKRPKAADDAAAAMWVPLDKLDLDKIAFPSVRSGLERIVHRR